MANSLFGGLPNQAPLNAHLGRQAYLDRVPSQRVTRTSAIMLDESDNGSFIDITSGTFAQVFDLCANLGASWRILLRNSGTGTVTLTPSGADAIDGASSVVMESGALWYVHCDGAALATFRLEQPSKRGFANIVVCTSTQTWAPPAGVTVAEVTVVDGGAGGRYNTGGSATDYLPGGVGGNAGISVLSVSPTTTYTATIGAGGSSGFSSGAGGASSFSGSGITTLTTSNASIKVPGGLPQEVGTGIGPSPGGGTLLAPLGSTGFGAGGHGGNSNSAGSAANGQPGVVIIRF